MLLQASSFSSGLFYRSLSHSTNCRDIVLCGAHYPLLRGKAKATATPPPPPPPPPSSCTTTTTAAARTVVCTSVGSNEIAEIAHNKVLIAAAASAAIGQLSKPFTSAIFYGNSNTRLDVIKAAFRAGGFPSTHSSAAVATAVSLGLERGFSDAVFGLAVVYASLVMYDAQGVRREVGVHAKALNKVLHHNSISSEDADGMIDSQPRTSSSKRETFEPLFLEEANSFSRKQTNAKLLLGAENRKGRRGMRISSSLASDVEGEPEKVANSWAVPLLKESVGHNEIEVIAGALLGLFVCLAVYNIT